MERFAVSLLFKKIEGSREDIHNSLIVTDAVSEEEAVGIALRHKKDLMSSGWSLIYKIVGNTNRNYEQKKNKEESTD